MAREYVVATLAQVAPGCMKRVEVDGRALVVYNDEGALYASDDVCPHRGAPLSAGYFAEGVVMCPLHAWEFDVATGECVSLPEARCLVRHEVRVADGFVTVLIHEDEPDLDLSGSSL
jgi:nitrite reductase/ring-hydroxylating ferredoxin subunit